MLRYDHPDQFPQGRSTALTIGKFDGVHLGHRRMLARLRARAAETGFESMAVTFDRNPLELLHPERCPLSLVSNEQKAELLAETGIDHLLVLPFTEELAAQEPEAFVAELLVGRLGARLVLTGPDFRFGARGRGDVSLLRALGDELDFAVELIDEERSEGGKVSSTRIRSLLAEGEVAAAGRLLGRAPTVRGLVVHGDHRGRELGFPTANIDAESEGLVPADGVYAGFAELDGRRYRAAISVGTNPTFSGTRHRRVEAYLLDTELDLYGRRITVQFVEWLRGMVAFDSVEALIDQMNDDVTRTRTLLRAERL